MPWFTVSIDVQYWWIQCSYMEKSELHDTKAVWLLFTFQLMQHIQVKLEERWVTSNHTRNIHKNQFTLIRIRENDIHSLRELQRVQTQLWHKEGQWCFDAVLSTLKERWFQKHCAKFKNERWVFKRLLHTSFQISNN